MRKILALIKTFIAYTLVGVLGHIIFYIANFSAIEAEGETAFFPMLWHALRLDVAIAGYASLIPGLIFTISVWWRDKALAYIWWTHSAIICFAMVLANVANIVLYGFWGFPLDSTPLFYLFTSPADAMASAGTLELLFGTAVTIFITFVIYHLIDRFVHPRRAIQGVRKHRSGRHHHHTPVNVKCLRTFVLLALTASLIIPIRGGFSVASNNVGSVYFSSNYRLNHTAVNPVFSFLYSVSHDEDFSSKYRFMYDWEATSLFDKMVYTKMRATDSTAVSAQSFALAPDFMKSMQAGKQGEKRGVNVVMVVMESFSKYIMTETGHVKGVTSTLDALSNEGVYFTNMYANSYRTDRALVSILSGYPAQPTTSLMKYPHKTNNLYGIARSLRNVGFQTKYIYGGDANFTNMSAYLHATGFEAILSDEDFDSKLPRNKWGVHDDALFSRAVSEIKEGNGSANRLFVLQTSSSHEPFDVPVSKFKDKALNAFYFTDQCLGSYIADLKKEGLWDNTLLLLVPDHVGCYPMPLDNFQLHRFQIPMILTGGAITETKRIDTICSQQDIPATLLTLLGVKHDDFKFSKDILDPKSPHFAFFTVNDAVGMATEDNQVIYDNVQQKTVLDQGKAKGKNLKSAQAYLQKLYDDIDSLSK